MENIIKRTEEEEEKDTGKRKEQESSVTVKDKNIAGPTANISKAIRPSNKTLTQTNSKKLSREEV